MNHEIRSNNVTRKLTSLTQNEIWRVSNLYVKQRQYNYDQIRRY